MDKNKILINIYKYINVKYFGNMGRFCISGLAGYKGFRWM